MTAASLDTFTTSGRRPSRADAASDPRQRLRQAERTDEVGRERQLQVFTIGVGERSERHGAKRRSVVDEHVEPAQCAEHLYRDRMDILLARDVPDDADGTGPFAGDALHAFAVPRDEGDERSAVVQLAHQRQPEARRAPGDRDAQLLLAVVRTCDPPGA